MYIFEAFLCPVGIRKYLPMNRPTMRNNYITSHSRGRKFCAPRVFKDRRDLKDIRDRKDDL